MGKRKGYSTAERKAYWMGVGVKLDRTDGLSDVLNHSRFGTNDTITSFQSGFKAGDKALMKKQKSK